MRFIFFLQQILRHRVPNAMSQYVPFQITAIGCLVLAVGATKRLFSRMHSYVNLQPPFLNTPVRAVRAGVWLLPRMPVDVVL